MHNGRETTRGSKSKKGAHDGFCSLLSLVAFISTYKPSRILNITKTGLQLYKCVRPSSSTVPARPLIKPLEQPVDAVVHGHIPPVNPMDPPRSYAFIYNNIFFSFAIEA